MTKPAFAVTTNHVGKKQYLFDVKVFGIYLWLSLIVTNTGFEFMRQRAGNKFFGFAWSLGPIGIIVDWYDHAFPESAMTDAAIAAAIPTATGVWLESLIWEQDFRKDIDHDA